MTRTEVQTAAEAFLQALDAAPTGTGTVLKDRGSKEWMETCVLRALAKLDAATYHSSRVARLVTESNDKGAAFFQTLELGADGTEGKWSAATKTVGSTRGVQEIAFEIDAFLAASRAAIDFGGAVLALHTGMGKRTGITTFLEVIKKAKKPIFPFLVRLGMPWIEALKAYRDECVHYRALRMQTGYESSIAQRQMGDRNTAYCDSRGDRGRPAGHPCRNDSAYMAMRGRWAWTKLPWLGRRDHERRQCGGS